MMQQMLYKSTAQLQRLEAEEEHSIKFNAMQRRLSSHVSDAEVSALSRRRPSAAFLPNAAAAPMPRAQASRRRLSQGNHLEDDIELSEVNVAVISNSVSSESAANTGSPFKSAIFLKAASRLKSRISDLVDLANGEFQRNSENELGRNGSAVRYGDVIQLRHVVSKKFVALASGVLSSYELSTGDMDCWFAFEPVRANIPQNVSWGL